MPMRRRALAMLAMALTAVTGCTGPTDPPTPTTTSQPSPQKPRPSSAPDVGEPIDLRPYRRHSCALLNAAQLQDLGLPPQTFEGADAETGVCRWDADGRYGLDLYVTGDPLAVAYRDSNLRLDSGEWRWPLFEPQTIRGLPAVTHSTFDPETYCEVVVSTGNGQGIDISGSVLEDDADPELCDRLVTAAGLVIDAVQR